jgi:hypothetical protein
MNIIIVQELGMSAEIVAPLLNNCINAVIVVEKGVQLLKEPPNKRFVIEEVRMEPIPFDITPNPPVYYKPRTNKHFDKHKFR